MASSQHDKRLRAELAAEFGWYPADLDVESIARHRADAARRAMTKRYEKQVDPEGVLDPAERAKRVENARKAHMLSMALKSAKARRLRGQAAQIEAELEAEDVPVNGGQA